MLHHTKNRQKTVSNLKKLSKQRENCTFWPTRRNREKQNAKWECNKNRRQFFVTGSNLQLCKDSLFLDFNDFSIAAFKKLSKLRTRCVLTWWLSNLVWFDMTSRVRTSILTAISYNYSFALFCTARTFSVYPCNIASTLLLVLRLVPVHSLT